MPEIKLYSFYFEVRDGEDETGYHELVLAENKATADKLAMDYVLHFFGEKMHPDTDLSTGKESKSHFTGGGADYRIVEYYGDTEEILNPAQEILTQMVDRVINRPHTKNRLLLQMLLASRGFLPKYSVDKVKELVEGLNGLGLAVTDSKLLTKNLKTMLDGLTLAALTESVPKEKDD